MADCNAGNRKWRGVGSLDPRGVSLLEVMISMAVFMIGMLGLARMQIIASGSNAQAAKTDRAQQLAAELMEFLLTLPFDDALLSDTVAGDDMLAQGFEFSDLDDPSLASLVDHWEFDSGNLLSDYLPNSVGGSCDPSTSTCFFGAYGVGGPGPMPSPGWPTTDFNGDLRYDFVRFWQVKEIPSPSGGVSKKIISVVVRWRDGALGRYRHVTLVRVKNNPVCAAPGGSSIC